jgi:hypothetical protein
MEINVLDVLAEAVGGTRAQASLWREVRGESGLMVAMEQARRVGIRAMTLAIDFGLSDVKSAASYFATLAETVKACDFVKLTVIAAGRGDPPDGARPLMVAPTDSAEAAIVALSRVRTIDERAGARIADAYQATDLSRWDPRDFFPFHPASLATVSALAPAASSIAGAALLLREVLAQELEAYALGAERLIYPCDVTVNPYVARLTDQLLGETGAAAAGVARAAALKLGGNERALAREMVETLIAAQIAAPGAALSLDEFAQRVPMLAEGTGVWSIPALAALLGGLETASAGAIVLTGGAVRFDPSAGSAPEAARFNAALSLVRRFVPDLEPVRNADELQRALRRLTDAMANAVENASRTRSVLAAAMAEARLDPPQSHGRAIQEYISLADRGPVALIEAATDPAQRESAARRIAAYEELAAAAAVIPRMRAMREYLRRTGLRVSFEEDPARDPRVSALETECQLLGAEIGPRVLDGPPRNLDAIEARFQKFKWTYVQLYRAMHAAWAEEMERMALAADDSRRYLAALSRLNAIGGLGPPEAAELAPRLADVIGSLRRCDLEGSLAVEDVARCPRCGYVLGEQSPRAQLHDISDRLRRALDLKLAALSSSAIARLIRQHDRAHRLEGFLKIVQAAQTEALVRVLDDRLARYLARLLDENLAPERGSAVVEQLGARAARPRGVNHRRRK